MSNTKDSISFIAENLRRHELYPKISEMLNYIVEQYAVTDIQDVEFKFTDPDKLSEDAISAIIEEYGFRYINEIVDTLTGIETNILIHFISLLHLLKGHRRGLELVLKVLGFDSVIEEWWEQSPKGEPATFNMVVFFNLSNLAPGVSVFEVLDRIRLFAREYVYPKFQLADVQFEFNLADMGTAMAGFTTQEKSWEIVESL